MFVAMDLAQESQGIGNNLPANTYIAEWVTTCDKAKIKIDTATVVDDIAAFWQEAGLEESGWTAGPSSDRQFSKETFVNAILEWIVVDDQVSLIHFYYDYKFGPCPHDDLKCLQVIDCPEL